MSVENCRRTANENKIYNKEVVYQLLLKPHENFIGYRIYSQGDVGKNT